MKKIFIIIMISLSLIMLSGCDDKDYSNTIYVTIYPIEYMTKEIVGDHYNVVRLYPVGADAHHYEPSTKDIVEISKSKYLFYIGAGLELFVSEAQQSTFKDQNVELLELSLGMDLYDWNTNEIYTYNDHDEVHYHNLDPHIWMDPNNMIYMGNKILNKVIEDKPELESEFRSNFEQFKENMLTLDGMIRDVADNATLDTIIVDHDAYVYWTLRYGINRIRIRTDEDGSNTSFQVIIDIEEQAEQLGITKVLMTKNVGDSNVALQIIDEINGTKLYLHNLAVLSNEEVDIGATYYTLMEDNIEILREALE